MSTPPSPISSLSLSDSETHSVDDQLTDHNKLDLANRIVVITSVVLVVLTIIFIGLATGSYMHPIAPLISFGSLCPLWLALKIIECTTSST